MSQPDVFVTVAPLYPVTDAETAFPSPRPVEPAPLRDPALGPEKTVDELIAESQQIRADLARAVELSRWARGAYDAREAA